WHLGLFPIPLGGPDGKQPRIRGFTKMPRLSLATVRKWIVRFPGANIGIVTGGVSGVIVPDIDSTDRADFDVVEERFGQTPLKVRTPSGGVHLYYRNSGERCRDLRPELPVDFK